MGVTCYQIVDFRFSRRDVWIDTYSRAPWNTNIESLLRRVAPSVRFNKATSSRSARFQIEYEEESIARQLLSSLQKPTVVAIVDECTLAVCLDFYSHEPGNPNARTEIGKLVYQAKYLNEEQAARELAKRSVSHVSDNPLLRRAKGVAVVPPWKMGKKTGPLLASIADALSSELGIPPVGLQRWRSAKKAQKGIDPDKGDDPELNQRGTMVVVGNSPERVLVVDDLIGYGDSVRETSRALQAGGTTEVMALVLSKNLKGTRSYKF